MEKSTMPMRCSKLRKTQKTKAHGANPSPAAGRFRTRDSLKDTWVPSFLNTTPIRLEVAKKLVVDLVPSVEFKWQ